MRIVRYGRLRQLFDKLRAANRFNRVIRRSKYSCLFGPEQLALYVTYITYKCQLALYELYGENGDSMSWQDFVLLMRGSEALRCSARNVMAQAMQEFDAEQFDFELSGKVSYNEQSIGDETTYMARLFEDGEGAVMLRLFMLQTETEHCFYLRRSNEGYTWKAYLNDVRSDRELSAKLVLAFQDGIRKLDFKRYWQSGAYIK